MVDTDDKSYRSYFATSPSTDKTNGKSKSVSQASSTANASVDSPGNAKAHSIAKSQSSSPEASASRIRQQEPTTNNSPSRAPPRPSQARVTRSTSGLISPSATNSDTSSPSGSRNASPEPVSRAQDLLNKKKKEIVDRVMVEVFHPLLDKWIEQTVGVMSHAADACDDDGGGGGNSGRSGRAQQGRGGGEPKKPLSGQKRQYQRDDDPDEDDPLDNGQGGGGGAGGGGGGRIGNKRARRSADNKRFACPYFKHNQKKYTTERTCCGPGWVDVHRVKEHIYRKHALPEFICDRCCKDLKNADALRQHHRSETPCELKNQQQLDGFDKHTEKLLRSRTNPGTERQKWEEMYRILFPGELVPSPYYDDKGRSDHKSSAALAKYEDYLRRELPPLVQHELEVEVEKELNCVEDAMKVKAVEIFRNVSLRLFNLYKHDTEPNLKPDMAQTVQEQQTRKKSKKQDETTRLSPRPEPPEILPLEICGDPDLTAAIVDFEWDSWFAMVDGSGIYGTGPPMTVS